ncbi:lactate oxidase [Pseudomonas sp. 3A(2025)]
MIGNQRQGPLRLINLEELEALAAELLDTPSLAYIAGGAGAEQTLAENRASFERRFIAQRVLSGKVVERIDIELLGIPLASPILVAPMGGQAIVHQQAEADTARGAAAVGTLMAASTVASLSLEAIAQASSGPKWFQLYLTRDEDLNRELIERAVAAGYQGIVLTVDVPVGGLRERSQRQDFSYPAHARPANFAGLATPPVFEPRLGAHSLAFVRQHCDLPLIVKGIATADDARLAIELGADALQVSNHGGRQLDATPGAFAVLPGIARAVAGRVPIVFDGGIRRGVDVFKALASGANAVALGRPILYGLALGGWQGVASVLEHLNAELRTVMQLAGSATIEDIRNTPLVDRNGEPLPGWR